MLKLNWGLVSLTAVMLGACAYDTTTDAAEVGSVTEALNTSWSPIDQYTPLIVGMSRAPASVGRASYAWYSDGWVCRGGSDNNVCSSDVYPYSAPAAFTSIVAVGIAVSNSRVVTWYSDSKVSVGTSDNLSAYNPKVTFTRPAKPSGGTFAMADLIDVDNSSNGEWYYYWKVGSQVFRSTGTLENGGSRSAAVLLPASAVSTSHGQIMGISWCNQCGSSVWLWNGSFWYESFSDLVETWYADGTVNKSSSSMNLNQ